MRQSGPNHFSPMTMADLDEILAVEVRAYPFPWTRQNFADSLAAGHHGVCLRAVDGTLLGYFLLMPVVDEAHLLNVCVTPEMQGNGLGVQLLEEVVRVSRAQGMGGVLLEVRPSNLRALRIYERFGFEQIGRRKGYYPASGRREDAIVMRLSWETDRAVA
ncbi:ribosomal protein S18-alanine N-acetyltransferase [Pandoraea nosoerga]|uniref:[Ribosomal protein bS18]-alanine N-acetyltransferase n=1 Tax=Pandoraea nosoerga TaxID=2508296 RepID=A0A5E4VCH6_9BURK|nr:MULTISPECIES: ribosomal protein S18-alanine N-acetyltransferase [Pandoraea]MBN4665998.1 ribosomal protein S18-alanine N-acetyltransferase [Pandoraea nosoerga]MBN4676172.1 ribosomal protein S18-alanine N-acetyltransferase [Pandoraea nosoerga]MBN4681230.1 ribosomal protein S18-alanine N-acetyltransferase [Pandoraea nosoerga]MBN4745282.1 ribosomal protein S18-alanine N-acetyltransferase [Pandoraea nosoerga]VVE09831.1 GCN5 family acetyltransferase [Pandoraea nosoerga]